MRRGALALAVLALAGCGGGTHHPAAAPKPAHLPRALAHAWATEADAVAGSLAAGDGCGAQQQANRLRSVVAQAVGRHQVPARYRATLVSAIDELPARITCNPTPPAPAHPHPHPHPHPFPVPPGHDHGPGHGPGHDHHGGHG